MDWLDIRYRSSICAVGVLELPQLAWPQLFKIIITAKLLQLNRITNVDGRYSIAPVGQMQCWW